MKFDLTSYRVNIIVLILLVLLGGGSFAYNNFLLNRILKSERSSVKLWAKAMEAAGNETRRQYEMNLQAAANSLRMNPTVPDSLVQKIASAAARPSSNNFIVQQIILNDRFKIPAIVVNRQGKILASNHLSGRANQRKVHKMAKMHAPVKIHFGTQQDPRTQFVYYGESPTVRYLRWFPYIQISLLVLLLGMVFLSYRTISKSEQSNILVGMTKEAAHQLGTPLSSMYGWISLLRDEPADEPFVRRIASELENDVSRLQGVAERFNKIGSEPDLKVCKLAPQIEQIINYVERRLPQFGRKIDIKSEVEPQLRAEINPELFQWALENILKNSINALKSTRSGALISFTVKQKRNQVQIDIKDTGRGIEKKYQKEIFKPGFSTKKRGWGLGLSLTKRIIEEYHSGKIFVKDSEIGKGTTLRIMLKAVGSTAAPEMES